MEDYAGLNPRLMFVKVPVCCAPTHETDFSFDDSLFARLWSQPGAAQPPLLGAEQQSCP